jgi:tetratricopeptide (TPR) repeat protein
MDGERFLSVHQNSGRDSSSASAVMLAQAKALHEQGKLDEAQQLYTAVIEQMPENAEALHQYGVLQFQRGRIAEAEALMRRSVVSEAAPLPLANLGSVLLELGRREEALAQFDAALAIDPRHLRTLIRRGNTLVELGRHVEALEIYGRAIEIAPTLLDAWCNRGSSLRALGRNQEALDSYDRALAIHSQSFESLYNRGHLLREMQRYEEALDSYDRALVVNPMSPEVLSIKGTTLVELGRYKEALSSFNEAIIARPDFIDAIYNSVVALERLGRFEEAVVRCERVLALQPHHARAFANRGNARQQLGRLEEALVDYDRALTIQPSDGDVLCNRGSVLRQLRRLEEALSSYDAALRVHVGWAVALCNRANVLQEMRRYDEALTTSDEAVSVDPDYAVAWLNRGNLFQEMGRAEDAMQAYERAIAIDPSYAEAHLSLSFVQLRTGDFQKGWERHEWRLRYAASASMDRVFSQPRWHSDTSLAGKTILLHAEQGLGDTIQFCRYADLVHALGARVILEVQPALKTLLTSVSGPSQVFAIGEPLPEFDIHCSLMSLPFLFGTDLSNLPASTPYLHADPRLVDRWSEQLGQKRGLRVGLVWSGNPEHRNDHNRSILLTAFAPLLEADVDWISLQKVVRPEDQITLMGSPLRQFSSAIRDFSDTAAMLNSIDLVITVDTAVAHLAGAMNCPVWVLVPSLADWRWMTQRTDNPWYPSARLFRQAKSGDWQGVLEDVRVALGELLQ